MRMYRFLSFLLLLSPFALSAQIDDPEAVFRELRTLEGTWFMPTERGDKLEVWSIVDDSTMTGQGLRIRQDTRDTITLETMRLELRDTTITYTVVVRGQNQNQPVTFTLTEADYEGYLFENPAHDNPKKIRYLLLGNRELQVLTEGRRGNRTVTEDFVFEREFTPAGVEFRLLGGINASLPQASGNVYFADAGGGARQPEYTAKPGWEIGIQTLFKGRGGFVNIGVNISLSGRYFGAQSDLYTITRFTDTSIIVDSVFRNVTYNSTWAYLSITPEITFKRDGRLSLIAGPYIGRLLGNRAKGDQAPAKRDNGFDTNSDFLKTDIGLILGLQYKLNLFKKDLAGVLGVRGTLGLRNIDDLYSRGFDNDPLRNGQVKMTGLLLYYSISLSKL